MTVSLVWYGTPHSAMASGTTAREPAAITTLSGGELVAVVGAQRVRPVGPRRLKSGVAREHLDIRR